MIEMLIVSHPEASGLYHVSSEPISKYDLLCLIRDKLGLPIGHSQTMTRFTATAASIRRGSGSASAMSLRRGTQ